MVRRRHDGRRDKVATPLAFQMLSGDTVGPTCLTQRNSQRLSLGAQGPVRTAEAEAEEEEEEQQQEAGEEEEEGGQDLGTCQ